MLGAIENEQLDAGGGAAAWLTVNVCPAIARLPFRAPPLLAATLNVAVPGPLPLAGEVKVIQDAWLVAVHAHPADVEIVIVVPPPLQRRWIDCSEQSKTSNLAVAVAAQLPQLE